MHRMHSDSQDAQDAQWFTGCTGRTGCTGCFLFIKKRVKQFKQGNNNTYKYSSYVGGWGQTSFTSSAAAARAIDTAACSASPAGKYSGGNSYQPQPTPDWQKKVDSFFIKDPSKPPSTMQNNLQEELDKEEEMEDTMEKNVEKETEDS